MSTNPLLNLPDAQMGDLSAGNVGGRDVHVEGVDARQVVDLLGERIERQIAQVATSTGHLVVAIALLVCINVIGLLLWGSFAYLLVQPYLIAGR